MEGQASISSEILASYAADAAREVEGVREILGAGTVLTGFYSYGEISPSAPGGASELHNQTMTVTIFCES